ncbi:hypothetical protein TNCV_312351 [Trichonephila clavipes]|nr:hypothetical protein TNCV_312351 [Trichonephila clavipes]
MNNLEALKTMQIVMENGKLGISSLHAWIKWFESLPCLSYRLDIKKLSVRKADRLLVDARKRYCNTSTGSIEENFIRFLAVTETTGEYLTNAILGELDKKGLIFRTVVDKDTIMVQIW